MKIAVPAKLAEPVAAAWRRTVAPGSTLTGEQRRSVVAAVRGAETGVLSDHQVTVVRAVYDEPTTPSKSWLDRLMRDGLQLDEYVELIGLASTIRAIDGFDFGTGRTQRDAAQATNGAPSDTVDDTATFHGSSLIPTTAPPNPGSILSRLPDESEAMNELMSHLYLTIEFASGTGTTMGNMAATRDGLSRAQMELVAARTSLLNDCFF